MTCLACVVLVTKNAGCDATANRSCVILDWPRRDSNPHARYGPGILSPVRLPIPPLGLVGQNCRKLAKHEEISEAIENSPSLH